MKQDSKPHQTHAFCNDSASTAILTAEKRYCCKVLMFESVVKAPSLWSLIVLIRCSSSWRDVIPIICNIGVRVVGILMLYPLPSFFSASSLNFCGSADELHSTIRPALETPRILLMLTHFGTYFWFTFITVSFRSCDVFFGFIRTTDVNFGKTWKCWIG